MPSYNYRASTRKGKIVEGVMEAADDGSAALKLQEMGLIPVRVAVGSPASIFSREISLPWKSKSAGRKELLIFTRELRTLVHAGFPLDRSLVILGQLAESPAMADVIQDVLKEVKGGKSFSEGLTKHPAVFPKVYISMVKAGEAGGVLDEILGRLVSYLETGEELRAYITGAMIYPALLSIVGLVSIVILTVFVVPKFTDIFTDIGVPLPPALAVLDFLSGIFSTYWWLVLLLLVVAFSFAARFRKSEEGRLRWDRWLLRIPLVGAVLQKIEVARFSRTLGTLLHGGVPLLQSMTIVRDVIGNRSIAKSVEPIRNGIKKGEGISQPMRKSGVFPPLAMHLVEVGEESGRLDGMLVQVAEIYDTDVRNSVKKLVTFFEPALILLMGIVIGVIVVSMLMAIFSIQDVPL
ncbi:MAG TPA: type II secretion system F family protein [Acidobacteriota bacterium]|nr:type II secretion system F family protein [Acidobacteriota bacterium]